MDKVFNYLNGFFNAMVGLLMSLLPLTIMWEVLSGTTMFGMDVITNVTALVEGFGTGGFAGLVTLVLLAALFVGKK
jgi:hypothetical protein|tara:strand:- start:656 stop:883 length:228 start_codon:yes stop_codon:yes gene_type:complete